ncbi:hypothetical protein [Candidatus Uabimicrobium sp. HlEnr_7]|uniref:hypothetical protein n=1 Tax=Candidatus Uabimicrobium helgolandensis TaxID=3095367 RepID=UPI0035590D1B
MKRTKLEEEYQKKRRRLISQKDWKTLLDLCDRLIEEEISPKRYCGRASIYHLMGHSNKALSDYKIALEMDSKCGAAQRGIEKILDI